MILKVEVINQNGKIKETMLQKNKGHSLVYIKKIALWSYGSLALSGTEI